ncbi:MAG: hypothetical protein EU535_02880 [Promethearchaeota archaeon]|nr:MAG: hypothetical protein EU535_02880 [Candidatus Lokiarchaeota archaeon]
MIALKSNPQKKAKSILIFDTNIFLLGIDFNLIDGLIYTTPEVIEEIRHKKYLSKNRNILNKIYAAIESKKLILKNASDQYFQEIEHNSKITGDYNALSAVDKGLVALTLELRETVNKNVKIYTNDYTIENICSELNISFSPLNKKGIKSKTIWEVYCPYCNEVFKPEDLHKYCDRCGLKLKRRPKK